jgi:enoyl-CoA hydratase/carnithine racemase
MPDTLLTERSDDVLTIVINRPEVSNAIDAATSHAIDQALRDAEADATIGAVILTGAGEKAFCSGMDLKEAARSGVGLGLIPGRGFCGLTERPFAKPLIAAINGAAVAGGFELALACDIILASEKAVFGLSEVKRGLVAYAGGVQRLARLAPRSLAMEMILTGAPQPARRLYEAGLVSRIVPAAALRRDAFDLARAVVANGWLALRLSKALFERSLDLPLADALAAGHEVGAQILGRPESLEGVGAYAEGRPANFAAQRGEERAADERR